MGLFDLFRKKKRGVPLPHISYEIAYFVLPHYAYKDIGKLTDLCLKTPTAADPFFYLMACQVAKIEPVLEDAKRFRWHHGQLTEGVEYFALEYPVPPPVDFLAMTEKGDDAMVLAPHFSAIIRDTRSKDAGYFVLGQAPVGGGTTLRHVTRDGANCNLGPGPMPRLDEFLDAIRSRGSKKPV